MSDHMEQGLHELNDTKSANMFCLLLEIFSLSYSFHLNY